MGGIRAATSLPSRLWNSSPRPGAGAEGAPISASITSLGAGGGWEQVGRKCHRLSLFSLRFSRFSWINVSLFTICPWDNFQRIQKFFCVCMFCFFSVIKFHQLWFYWGRGPAELLMSSFKKSSPYNVLFNPGVLRFQNNETWWAVLLCFVFIYCAGYSVDS